MVSCRKAQFRSRKTHLFPKIPTLQRKGMTMERGKEDEERRKGMIRKRGMGRRRRRRRRTKRKGKGSLLFPSLSPSLYLAD